MFTHFPESVIVFLRKGIVFALPIVLPLLFLELVGMYSGELISTRAAVRAQLSNSEILYGRGIISQDQHVYKYLSLIERRPEVIVLGSSRVMQIREEMFPSDVDFYNAGGILQSMEDVADFFTVMPEEYAPKVILLGLDYFWLTDSHTPVRTLQRQLTVKDDTYLFSSHVLVMRALVSEVFTNPDLVRVLLSRKDPFASKRTLGIGALTGDGFSSDGSRQKAKDTLAMRTNPEYVDRESPPIIDRIENGILQFTHNSSLSEEKVKMLESFLNEAKQRGTLVVGFTPPFSSEAYARLCCSPEFSESFGAFQKKIEPVFTERGFPFSDFSNVESLGISNAYMFDGFHPTETGTAHMVLSVFENTDANGVLDSSEVIRILERVVADEHTTPVEIAWPR